MLKKILFVISLLILTGCNQAKVDDYNPLDITMKINDASTTSGILKVTLNSNSIKSIKVEERYWIEKETNNTWKEVVMKTKPLADNWKQSSSKILNSKQTITMNMNWNQYYRLTDGKYRVRKYVRYDNQDYVYYAYFNL